jgi:hypothetical protein
LGRTFDHDTAVFQDVAAVGCGETHGGLLFH